MNRNNKSFPGRARTRQRGQVLVLVLFMMICLLGMVALTVDVGAAYVGYQELTYSTNAAALAGAAALPGSNAQSAALSYSAVAGDMNAYSTLPGVTMTSTLECLTTLTGEGIPCVAPANANAISVTQQVSVPTIFARVFGYTSFSLGVTSTAAMRGAALSPYNVAIVVDTTKSMNDTDSDSQCNGTRISCALAGIAVLLGDLSPCSSSQASCGAVTGGNVASSVDRVSLLAFPSVLSTTAANDYTCGSTAPSTTAYAIPLPSTSTYQIVNFSSDYRTSDTATSMNPHSEIVAAVQGTTGSSNPSPCMQVKGGFGTYYAQVIYAAQQYLVTEQASYPNSQNVLILLSDGDATATCKTSSGGVCTAGDMPGASTTSGVYMSTLQQCAQAVTAAQAAVKAGTRVYAVAYGAEASGCAGDTSPAITPCQTMQQIASSASTFFSDYTAAGSDNTCVSSARPTSNLNQIFTEIAGDFTVARLIPNNTP